MAPKRAHKELTVGQKVCPAKFKKSTGCTFYECRKAFWAEYGLDREEWKLPPPTLSKIIGKSHLNQRANKDFEASDETSKHQHGAKYPVLAIEEALTLWAFDLVETRHLTLTDALVKVKTKELGQKLSILESFKHSLGWLDKFKKRHGLKSCGVRGEARAADIDMVEQTRLNIHKILYEYHPNDIYKIDETGFYWEQQPNRKLARIQMSGGKQIEKRLTVALCCNTTGTDRMLPIIIHWFQVMWSLLSTFTHASDLFGP